MFDGGFNWRREKKRKGKTSADEGRKGGRKTPRTYLKDDGGHALVGGVDGEEPRHLLVLHEAHARHEALVLVLLPTGCVVFWGCVWVWMDGFVGVGVGVVCIRGDGKESGACLSVCCLYLSTDAEETTHRVLALGEAVRHLGLAEALALFQSVGPSFVWGRCQGVGPNIRRTDRQTDTYNQLDFVFEMTTYEHTHPNRFCRK